MTAGWENPATPNIYSCLYKPLQLSSNAKSLLKKKSIWKCDLEVGGMSGYLAALLINVIEVYITETEKEM